MCSVLLKVPSPRSAQASPRGLRAAGSTLAPPAGTVQAGPAVGCPRRRECGLESEGKLGCLAKSQRSPVVGGCF